MKPSRAIIANFVIPSARNCRALLRSFFHLLNRAGGLRPCSRPADAALPIALLLHRFWVERLFHRPIVRQVDLPPVRIIEPARRSTPSVAGLCAAACDVLPVKRGRKVCRQRGACDGE